MKIESLPNNLRHWELQGWLKGGFQTANEERQQVRRRRRGKELWEMGDEELRGQRLLMGMADTI